MKIRSFETPRPGKVLPLVRAASRRADPDAEAALKEFLGALLRADAAVAGWTSAPLDPSRTARL